jgi:hypothetical protein
MVADSGNCVDRNWAGGLILIGRLSRRTKILLGASRECFPRLGHLEKGFAVQRGRSICQYSALVGVLFERGHQPRDWKLPFKFNTYAVCIAPHYATRPGHPISINNKIKCSRDRTPYLQVRSRVRKIVNDALARVAVLPPCKTSPQNLLSWRTSTIWIYPAIVDDVSRFSEYSASKRLHALPHG